ncbi:MAG: alpha/beta hydrolase, partial [Actinobacteria bacterium]|nr:alpha/beta hydrolase [Actinomycetota bacterium]
MRSIRMGSGGRLKTGLRPRRLLVLAFLAGAVALAAVYWSWIDAQARAAVVLSSVLETPVLTPVVQALTQEPSVEDTVFTGRPTFVAKPAGEGPWPAILFVNGTVPEGRAYPEVQNLARGLARAGYLVVVPDLPGLTTDEITGETVSSTAEAARAVADRPDARDGQVGLVGVSTGATLSLLAAQDPAVGERVSVVAGVAPYTDIRTVLSIATTGHHREDGEYVPYEADPFLSYVIAKSLLAALPSGEERDALRAELEEVDRLDPNPLAGLRDRPTEDLSPEARSVVELLANTDPECFDELYAALPPEIRAGMEELSPLAGDERISAPVELTSGAWDKYFPVSESFAIDSIAAEHRVTVSEAIDHSEVGFSDIPA